jgi:hypothetical protein
MLTPPLLINCPVHLMGTIPINSGELFSEKLEITVPTEAQALLS